jgi:hypothetical protein
MKKIVYDYLNDSLGTKIYFRANKDSSFYNIFSTNGTRIIAFGVQSDWEHIKLFRGEELTKTVSSLFSITNDESSKFVKDWFGEIHNLKRVGDLRRLITQTESFNPQAVSFLQG